MNMKGVSPVVATVLLIAIAVIAAVGVWYWVGAYTAKPATTGTNMQAIDISCTAGSNATLIRNLGSTTITNVVFTVYMANMTLVGNFTVASLATLTSTNIAINVVSTSITQGSYKATATGFQDAVFNCL